MAGLWDPLRLTFRDSEVEALYDAWSECKSGAEVAACVMGIVACSGVLLVKGVQGSVWRMILVLGANLSWLLAGVCMATISGERRKRWRAVLVIAVQCSGFLVALTDVRFPSRVGSAADALVALLVKSPVSFTFFVSILLPLRFRDALKTHIVFAVSIVYFSASDFCIFDHGGETGGGGGGPSPFSKVGEKIDRVFEMTVFYTIELNDGHKCTCEAVATFFFLMSGALIPLVFSYCKEAFSRCLFLRETMPAEFHTDMWARVKLGLEFAVWLVPLGMQIAWIMFRKL